MIVRASDLFCCLSPSRQFVPIVVQQYIVAGRCHEKFTGHSLSVQEIFRSVRVLPRVGDVFVSSEAGMMTLQAVAGEYYIIRLIFSLPRTPVVVSVGCSSCNVFNRFIHATYNQKALLLPGRRFVWTRAIVVSTREVPN